MKIVYLITYIYIYIHLGKLFSCNNLFPCLLGVQMSNAPYMQADSHTLSHLHGKTLKHDTLNYEQYNWQQLLQTVLTHSFHQCLKASILVRQEVKGIVWVVTLWILPDNIIFIKYSSKYIAILLHIIPKSLLLFYGVSK